MHYTMPILLFILDINGLIIDHTFCYNLFDREKPFHVYCVHTLSFDRNNHVCVERFVINEINIIIDYIATG